MALYEFACPSCGNTFEKIVRNPTHMSKVSCPKCNGKKAKRKISRFAASHSGSTNADSGLSANCNSGFG